MKMAAALVAITLFTNARAGGPIEDQLRAEDQRLLIAIHTGDVEEWARVTTPDFLIAEEGEYETRDEFLSELKPNSGPTLRIATFRVSITGDIAMVVHIDNVPDSGYLPRASKAQYLMTETWQQIDGEWKLHIRHMDAIRTAPPTVPLTLEEMNAVEGRYMTNAGQLFEIKVAGTELTGGFEDASARKLEAETKDILFDPTDLRRRYILVRSNDGAIMGLIRRSENTDALLTKIHQ